MPFRLKARATGLEAPVAGVVRIGDESVSEVLSTALSCGGSWFPPDGAFTGDGPVLTIGTEMEGILSTPAGEGPFPLVVNIHGGPRRGFRDVWSMK
ncbi:alpha/beta hydrolase family protein [Actinomycetota bacterium Odt1-20B]